MFGEDGLYEEISHSVNSFSSADTNEGNLEVENNSDIAHDNLSYDSDKEDECAAKPDHCLITKNVPEISNFQFNR
jgi:hypothetical protein